MRHVCPSGGTAAAPARSALDFSSRHCGSSVPLKPRLSQASVTADPGDG